MWTSVNIPAARSSKPGAVTDPVAAASVAPVGPPDERVARQTLRRLASEFPAVPPQEIAMHLQDALARTSDAKVQTFRVVLAERRVRDVLRRLSCPGTSTGSAGPMESLEVTE